MAKMHDEAKDVRLLSRKMRVDYYSKTISANKNTIIGNNSWGRIDYLCHYCGWPFVWDNRVNIMTIYPDKSETTLSKKKAKKESKAPKLTNKKNKR